MEVQIFCPECKTSYKKKEKVIIDQIFTVSHEHCYNTLKQHLIIDSGIFEEIIFNYGLIK